MAAQLAQLVSCSATERGNCLSAYQASDKLAEQHVWKIAE